MLISRTREQVMVVHTFMDYDDSTEQVLPLIEGRRERLTIDNLLLPVGCNAPELHAPHIHHYSAVVSHVRERATADFCAMYYHPTRMTQLNFTSHTFRPHTKSFMLL